MVTFSPLWSTGSATGIEVPVALLRACFLGFLKIPCPFYRNRKKHVRRSATGTLIPVALPVALLRACFLGFPEFPSAFYKYPKKHVRRSATGSATGIEVPVALLRACFLGFLKSPCPFYRNPKKHVRRSATAIPIPVTLLTAGKLNIPQPPRARSARSARARPRTSPRAPEALGILPSGALSAPLDVTVALPVALLRTCFLGYL